MDIEQSDSCASGIGETYWKVEVRYGVRLVTREGVVGLDYIREAYLVASETD